MTREECVEIFKNEPVYAILGEALSLGRGNVETARQVLAAGVKIIQYREKHKSWREKYAEAKVIADLCRAAGAVFIMNDSADLAIACGAAGIHVGQDDAPCTFVRRLAGPDMFIGVSTNTIADIQGAIRDGADYVGFGPMHPTESKKDTHDLVTAEAIGYATAQTQMPLTCIGGVGPETIPELYKEGFRSFAMISAIVSQPDIAAAVAHIRQVIAQAAHKG
ncbi:thiamine phosphate synthase [Megasphaera hominis]|jgi:thiamine-phosphate pyrophosphorylase|uniref:Thiamine-phosphate synthase n=1 Tax=Megasphaera hominis TaxID=159836 RepID=A0ABR6VEW6_9FIRM|nr:thiamine phosphate synthase [Megasphaera hominis]MBC3535797.1 thiamine phosphate synthase [Megasphaera hominis]